MKIKIIIRLTLLFSCILVAWVILFFSYIGVCSFFAGGREYTSNCLMTCRDSAGLITYTMNYKPDKKKYTGSFNWNEPLTLSSSDSNSKNYKIISSGNYGVSTSRGIVFSSYAILKANDGKLYFCGNDIGKIWQVILNNSKPSSSDAEESKIITVFPIVKLDETKAVEAAKQYAFEFLKDVR